VPAGKHSIRFSFEPQSFIMGSRVTTISQFLMVILLAIGAWLEWRKRKGEQAAA
jgi:hypothetical protein